MKILNKFFLILTILISVLLLTSCNTKDEYEDAMTFSDDLAGVKLRGLYGFIDIEGNLKIKPSYEQVQSFYNGAALAKQNGLWGLIDKNNNIIVPFKYELPPFESNNFMLASNFRSAIDFISFKENNKYGCINLKGEVVVDFISSEPILMHYGLNKPTIAIITDNGKKGFIDLDTGFKVPPIYNDIYYGGSDYNIISLDLKGISGNLNFGYANLDTQTVIEPQYSNHLFFQSGLAAIEINGKYGYINEANEIVIDPIYDNTSGFLNPIHNNTSEFLNDLAIVTINKKSGYINTKGETVIPLIYDSVDPFYNGIAKISIDNKFGIINTKGEILCEPKFTNIELYGEGDIFPASYRSDDGKSKTVCINIKGEILFETNYIEISPFGFDSQELTQVRKNSKVGYINKKGIEILPPIYNSAQSIGDLFLVKINDKAGLIGKYQTELLKCEYTSITPFAENIFSISKDGKYGLYNSATNTSTELLYDEIRFHNKGAIPVRIGDKWHYIDLDGNRLKI
ncbi:MAG: WG repeat-containing protein [Clostridium sp.]|uniref:WG repeat-containing protein n=1 Tax=Clostridium sp. TaxID=1506 RepID=UPI00305B84E4